VKDEKTSNGDMKADPQPKPETTSTSPDATMPSQGG
jgi:hypothetical protein